MIDVAIGNQILARCKRLTFCHRSTLERCHLPLRQRRRGVEHVIDIPFKDSRLQNGRAAADIETSRLIDHAVDLIRAHDDFSGLVVQLDDDFVWSIAVYVGYRYFVPLLIRHDHIGIDIGIPTTWSIDIEIDNQPVVDNPEQECTLTIDERRVINRWW